MRYRSQSRHRREEVRAVISADYAWVRVTDRERSIDAEAFPCVHWHKGLALNDD